MAVNPNAIYGPKRGDANLYAALNPAMASQGLIAETFPRVNMQNSSQLVSGTVYFTAINLFAGQVVSNIVVSLTAATTVSLGKVGLYSTAGSRLALSAEQGVAWESAGNKAAAMITPYTVPTAGQYFIAIVEAAAAMAFVFRGSVVGAGAAQIGAAVNSGALVCGTQTAQSDLPTTATITAGLPMPIWAGVY